MGCDSPLRCGEGMYGSVSPSRSCEIQRMLEGRVSATRSLPISFTSCATVFETIVGDNAVRMSAKVFIVAFRLVLCQPFMSREVECERMLAPALSQVQWFELVRSGAMVLRTSS